MIGPSRNGAATTRPPWKTPGDRERRAKHGGNATPTTANCAETYTNESVGAGLAPAPMSRQQS